MSTIIPVSSLNSAYQMSGDGCCDSVTTSGLPIREIRPRKIHCILPSSPWLADSKTNIPLGVLYIAGLLRAHGHEVVVTSMLDKRYEGNIHLPDSVMDSDVHMFGFCTPQFGEALELAAYIKDRNPEALLVAGGPHPSYEPKEVKEAGRQDQYHYKGVLAQRRDYRAEDGRQLFDTVIVMEGEVATLQMLSDWDAGKLQPYYYGDKADAMDLDAIPFPAWDLLPHDHIYNDGVAVMKHKYFPNAAHPEASSAVMSLIGTRGCFAAGTPIMMADGTQRPVEFVKTGDFVSSFDLNNGRIIRSRVLQSRERDAPNLYRVGLSNGITLEVTGEHPFITRRGWQSVDQLKVGDSLRQVSTDIHIRSSNVTSRQVSKVLVGNTSRAFGDSQHCQNIAARFMYCVRTACIACFSYAFERKIRSCTTAYVFFIMRVRINKSFKAWRQKSCQTSRSCGTDIGNCEIAVSNYLKRSQTALGRWQNVQSSLYRIAERSREKFWGVVAFTRFTDSFNWIRRILDRTVYIWQSSMPGFYSYQYASASGYFVQRSPVASNRGNIKTDSRLYDSGMVCPECMGRGLDEVPASGSSIDLGDRISGDWTCIESITFVGFARVYPITVEGGTFIAHDIASHNCPYRCTYCSTPWIGQKPRYRSSHNIIAEMALIFDKGVRQLKFQDDTYTLHRSKLRELALAVDSAFGQDSFAARIHTRVNTMDDHIAESLKLMSTKVTCFGIESGSQRVLNANQKGTTVEQNTAALKKAKEHGFYTIAFLVAGMSGETLETARETMTWLKSVKPYLDSCNLAVGIPYPGSRWWTHPQESGIDIVDYNYDNTWIVGFSARDEILVRPHGATIEEMFQIKKEMFDFLVSEDWAKAEWDEDVRIKAQQAEAVAKGTLTAASGLSYVGH